MKPIVIVGMGPGGIVAAIEAAKKGRKIIIVDNRDEFTRSQRVLLNEEMAYLKKLNQEEKEKTNRLSKQDRDFISTLEKESTVPVYLLQEFLERKLSHTYKNNIEIRKGKQYQVSGIDIVNGTVNIQNTSTQKNETIEFSHIIGADGAKHETANKITQAATNLRADSKIEYENLPRQTRQKAHGGITLKYTGKHRQLIKRELTYENLPQLKELGWNKPYPPLIHIFSDKKEKKFYIAGEIPSDILAAPPEKRRIMMEKWGKLILELSYGFKNSDIKVDVSHKRDPKSKKMDELKITAFPVILQYTETPSVLLPFNGAAVFVGDSVKNANFHLGHGANDAICDGRKIGELLTSLGTFDVAAYNDYQKKQREIMLDRMKQGNDTWQNIYHDRIESLDLQFKDKTRILIGLAASLPQNKELQDAKERCEKSLQEEPLRHEKVYLDSLELAMLLNKQANKILKAKEKPADQWQKLESKVLAPIFNTVTSIVPQLGKFLQDNYDEAKKYLDKRPAESKHKRSFDRVSLGILPNFQHIREQQKLQKIINKQSSLEHSSQTATPPSKKKL